MDPITVFYVVFGLLYLLIPLAYLATAVSSLVKRERCEEKGGELPSVTVLVPTFNDGENVKRVISSLEAADYPDDKLEIIFIDDSNDYTPRILEEFASRKRNVRVLKRGERLGKPSALNDGLRISKGEVVVVYDADSAPHPSAIRKLVMALDGEVVAAQGSYEVDARNVLNKIIDLEYALWQGSQLVAVPVIVGYNYAVKRSYLEGIGGWDRDALAEDHVLWLRIYSDGKKIRYVEDAKVRVLEPTTLRDFKKQRLRWSKGAIQAAERVVKAGKRRIIPKPYIPNTLVYTSRYSAPPQTAISLVALASALVAYIAFPQFRTLLSPLVAILLSAIATTSLASLLFCLRMNKLSRWIYFFPLSFLVLYQSILSAWVLRREVSWEKVQK